MSRSAARRTSTVATLLALVLALALAAGGCTGDDGDDKDSASSNPSASPAAEVQLRSRVGTVAGKLPKPRRQAVARQVGRVVDRWFEAAYVGGDYPRADFANVWPGFTRGARDLARRDRRLTSNALLGERIDGVVVKARTVQVDVFSPRNRPSGATARFRLVFRTTGKAERRVVVTGRLLLTAVKGTWKVFGFDVKRSAVAVGADRATTEGAS